MARKFTDYKITTGFDDPNQFEVYDPDGFWVGTFKSKLYAEYFVELLVQIELQHDKLKLGKRYVHDTPDTIH